MWSSRHGFGFRVQGGTLDLRSERLSISHLSSFLEGLFQPLQHSVKPSLIKRIA